MKYYLHLQQTFNSTRCIRNFIVKFFIMSIEFLSTPHGALGTLICRKLKMYYQQLSTPHGALGTFFYFYLNKSRSYFQLHTVHQERIFTRIEKISNKSTTLSTPHGALGTVFSSVFFCICILSFNSTRCIRNPCEPPTHWQEQHFQLHTVHQEPLIG